MARGKIIPIWSDLPDQERRNFAQALAGVFHEEHQDVLLVDCGHPEPHPDPAEWAPKFKALAPALLRNYLEAGDHKGGCLKLSHLPGKVQGLELFELLARAYDWVLVLAPAGAASQAGPLFEAASFVVWLGQAGPDLASRYEAFLGRLSPSHFPHAYVLPVEGPDRSIGSHPNEACLKELARRLEDQPGVARPKGDSPLTGAPSPDQAVDQLKARAQPELMKTLEDTTTLEADTARKTIELCLARDASLPASPAQRGMILELVMQDVLGLGPLDPLLKDPEVSEVMVNGPERVYVEKKGRLVPTDARFSSDKQLRTVIDRIVAPIGRRVDESMPLCDARLADGSRVNIVLPPLSLDGPTLTIRKFSARALGLAELERLGSLSPAMADFLLRAVRARRNIVVSGGTGSGKTTLLNALSGAIPDEERIVTIEDAAELKLQKPHVVRLESRPPNAEGEGAIPIRRLVINALRMRPDRIVVGECRGGEALDMLQAMNTGHDGSMTTLHANSPRDALGRLETLVLMAGLDLPVRVVREQIRSAIHLLVQQARLADGSRKVTSITEVTGMEGEVLTTQELYGFKSGCFEATGVVSGMVPS